MFIGSNAGRGAPDLDAALPARQGDGRQDDRGRPALHAHRALRRPLRAHPLRHRHPVGVRHAVAHLQERLGRQEVHRRPHLRHGRGAQGSVAKWTPDKVLDVTGVAEADRATRPPKMLAKNRPSSVVWCMGNTQHTSAPPTCARCASCSWRSAISACSGGGANIYRGHDNVQGATDVGPNPDSLPGYYGLAEGAWKHFAKVWGVDYDWIKQQYAPGHDGKAGHDGVALVRRRAREERADRPAEQPARRCSSGAMRRTARRRCRT